MKMLVIGSGGREDAFVWKLQQEKNVEKIFVCPGHPYMDRFDKVELLPKKNEDELCDFALKENIELTIVGPEAPLTKGVKDKFSDKGLALFGPSQKAAQLEGSKIFSKEFMMKHDIPTADFVVCSDFEKAMAALNDWDMKEGIVIKADGLAGGKGVVVTKDKKIAEQTLYDFMKNPKVSISTDSILLEKVLPGVEVSAFALCHGEEYFFLGSACDHKRVFDNDEGPNTGGMGCFRTPEWPDLKLLEKIESRILKPTLKGCVTTGMPFSGFLFMGLMINEAGDPYVIEYNVRMGDPETQTLFPLIEGDLSTGLIDLMRGKKPKLRLKNESSVHVVMTSGGYPSIDDTPLDKGNRITFTEDLIHSSSEETKLFLAGVSRNEAGEMINSGGRVLGVTALGPTLERAREIAYQSIELIDFKGCHYRRDIGARSRG